MTVTPITTSDGLAAFCESQKTSRYLAVDTEFVRESTYYPQLCLIQIAGDTDAAAIDTLAPDLDMTPLYELLAAPDILKVFHAARQDLEIFYNAMGQVPAPLFDTQIAAMVLGFGDQVGYEVLVKKVLNIQIDKSSRFTDWSKRPLTDRQIDYAMADVIHLRPVYEELDRRLEAANRAHWLNEEMAVLSGEEIYRNDPKLAWQRLKARGLKPRNVAVLQAVAAWREAEAQRRNVPRNRVVRDDTVLDIAGSMPKTDKDLGRIRGLGKNAAEGRMGQAILGVVADGLAIPNDQLPRLPRREPPAPGVAPITELLKVLLKAKCDELGIAARLIASGDDLERLAISDSADIQAMKGWRRELYGDDALRLKHGNLGLAIVNKAVTVIPLDENQGETPIEEVQG